MELTTWHDFYKSDLQGLYALLVVPFAFLAYRLAAAPDFRRARVPAAAGFVSVLTVVFAVETMIDPISTGPLIRHPALADTLATTAIPFLFVLLGDLRVLLLAAGVAHPAAGLRQQLLHALGLSLIVPVVSGVLFGLAGWIWPDVHGQVLWMIYEAGFLLLCVVLARSWVPRAMGEDAEGAAFLRSVFGFSAAYYALWLAADALIVIGGLDLGWAIRVVPNQLYYGLWAPFVYWRFFSGSASSEGPSS